MFSSLIIGSIDFCTWMDGENPAESVFIKDEAQVASRVGGAERAVLYFGKLLFESNEKKFGFRGVES